jgi:flagellar basal body-associated protein FliL
MVMEEPVERRNWTREELARRRKRSIVIALILAALVLLFYISTLVRLTGDGATL